MTMPFCLAETQCSENCDTEIRDFNNKFDKFDKLYVKVESTKSDTAEKILLFLLSMTGLTASCLCVTGLASYATITALMAVIVFGMKYVLK